MKSVLLSVLVVTLCLSGGFLPRDAGASPKARADNPSPASPLVFIILPVENVSGMYEKFLPLKEYLEKAVSRRIVLTVAQNYQETIESIGTGRAHFAYLDPSAYCEARHRYGVLPLAKAIQEGSSTYRSVIVARRDSPMRRIVEGKGKRLALGSRGSSSSALIPAVMYKEVGISLHDFAAVDYLEQEDRIALSVLTRRHNLGGLSERVAQKYINDGLKIIKTSEAIPQYTLCAYAGVPKGLRKSIVQALLNIRKDQHPRLIQAMIDIDGFAPAQDRDFDVVRVMIKNFTGKNYLRYRKNTVKVAILPLYSAITLYDRFDPLMRYLSRKTGNEFKLVIPKDFEDFFRIVKRGDVEYSYSNPYIYTQLADRGHLRAFANTLQEKQGDSFRGIIITHRDSPIKALADLKGKNVSVVSYRSAGGFLAQKLFLKEKGIDVDRDLTMTEGKRQEEVILRVYRKRADAGFVREKALAVLQEELDLRKIRILARTPYIPNWPFASTQSADRAVTARVQKHLVELNQSRVLSAAQITGFRAATDRDFDPLRRWIGKHVRK